MLLGGGTLEGVRIIGPKTFALMGTNHLPGGGDLTEWAQGSFSETTYEGIGFGLGFAVNLGMAATSAVGTEGELFWGGAASTIFWVDPKEDLACVFLTQLMPSGDLQFPRAAEGPGLRRYRALETVEGHDFVYGYALAAEAGDGVAFVFIADGHAAEEHFVIGDV